MGLPPPGSLAKPARVLGSEAFYGSFEAVVVEVLACPHCERMFNAAPVILGRTIRCRGCRKPFQIPQDPSTAQHGAESPRPQPVVSVAIECVIDGHDARRCPSCDRAFVMQPRFVGKTIRCRGCRMPFLVAAGSTQATSRPTSQNAAPAAASVVSPKPQAALATEPATDEVLREGVVHDDSGDVLEALPSEEPVLVAVRPRHIAKRRHKQVPAVLTLAAIVLGGVTALPATQLILWWAFSIDPLHVGRAMPPMLKVVVPVKFRR
jgi:hypothetical protein